MPPSNQLRPTASTMHRRGHKKSRNGCLECKRRHMKCDETRPQCANCTTVHRTCQYLESQGVPRVPYQSTSPASVSPVGSAAAGTHAASTSPVYVPGSTTSSLTDSSANERNAYDGSQTSGGSPASALTRQQTTPQTSALSTPRLNSDHCDEQMPVNMLHAELAFHFSCNVSSPELTDLQLLAISDKVVKEEAARVPFLLYECLAISARHLSVVRPERRDYYLRHSIDLQARAIAMFNDMNPVDNVVASLLFSSVVNRLALADVLANREGDFGSFLDRFVQGTLLQKGIRTVAKSAQPQVLESRLSPILKWAVPDRETVTTGHHCDELRRLISLTPALEPVDREACRTTIHYLQLAFDNYTNPGPGKSEHQLVFIWGMYWPVEFAALVKAHRSEAVAMMAWYAVLLHECREIWQVGDAGVFILQSVSDFLGPEWTHWLEWPLSAVRHGLPQGGTVRLGEVKEVR